MHFSSATEAFLEAASLAEDGFFEAATAAPAAPAATAASGLEAVFVCILHCYFLFFFEQINSLLLFSNGTADVEPNVSEVIVFVLVFA